MIQPNLRPAGQKHIIVQIPAVPQIGGGAVPVAAHPVGVKEGVALQALVNALLHEVVQQALGIIPVFLGKLRVIFPEGRLIVDEAHILPLIVHRAVAVLKEVAFHPQMAILQSFIRELHPVHRHPADVDPLRGFHEDGKGYLAYSSAVASDTFSVAVWVMFPRNSVPLSMYRVSSATA